MRRPVEPGLAGSAPQPAARAARRTARLLAAAATLALALAPAAALAQASASPYTNAIRYDAMGRLTGTIAADPNGDGALHHAAVRHAYDGAGRPVRVETGALAAWQSETVAPADWAGFTIFRTLEIAYDAMGRKTRELVREGAAGTVRSLTQYSYDAAGRLDCSAVRMNPAVFGSLPASACAPGTPGSDGPDRIARNVYDAAGQRLQRREGVGSADEGAEVTWAYNLDGQVVAVIDGNGNRAELRYDGHGRQDRWTFPSAARAAAFDDATPASALATAGAANASDYEEYGYDANGNRISLRKRDGSVLTYAYDNLNRMTVKAVPSRAGLTAAQTRDVYYGYDLRNLHLSARFDSQAGEGIINAYDGFGRLASTSIDMGGVTRTLGYAYDANGNRIRITHPDGTYFVTWHDGLSRPFYIQANGLAGLAYNFYTAHGAPAYTGRPGTAAVHSYDDVQRPIARALLFLNGTGNAAWSYGFNPAGQIGSVTRDNDAYAWTGHYAVNRAYTTNGLSQYSAAGSATFGYDPNGNLTSDGGRTYLYDVENRMVSTSAGAALIYDPLGRLFQLTASGGAVTRFLYDGDALVAEYDGTNAMTRRHVHWPGADLPMTTYESAGLGPLRQLYADHQGSVIALADENGANVRVNAYDEYGIPGAGNIGRFQYTGQAWLSELGMYYYKARIYSPTLGRFMQIDPIGYEGGNNLYAYVGDDPTNRGDPTGLAPGEPYLTSSDAAVDWENTYNPTSVRTNREYLGTVYQRNERYYSTRGVTRTARGGTATVHIPRGARQTQDVHTHGAYSREGRTGEAQRTGRSGDQYNSDNHSTADIERADRTAIPVTIGTPSGVYKTYDPATQNVETIRPYVPQVTPPAPQAPPQPQRPSDEERPR